MTARIVVVGLGPAGADLVTAGTLEALATSRHRFLRTARHPAAGVVEGALSFDCVYEEEPTFDAVYRRIVEELVAAATAASGDQVLYAVPGSPRVLERTVDLLVADGRVAVTVLAALSFADLAWVRLGVDPLEEGVRLVDGHRFADRAAGERGPLLVGHCHSKRVLSDIKLAFEHDPPERAVVLQRLGLPEEVVFEVAWADLDREVDPDHLTALYLPEVAAPVAAEVARFAGLVRELRERCPWDRAQNHTTLTRHLLEETYELLEAIDGHDPATGAGYDHVQEELGDLLFQVVFHCTLAAEAGAFTLADVARGIHEKLVARHPHVFGAVNAPDAETVMRNWEELKRVEKGRASVMHGIPGNLPSLLYAHKVQRKAASLGIEVDPPSPEPDDVGAALFALVAAARRQGIDPETALRVAADRFKADVEAASSAD